MIPVRDIVITASWCLVILKSQDDVVARLRAWGILNCYAFWMATSYISK